MKQSNYTATPISPLRQRMIDDMMLRKLKPRTQEAYIRAVKKLAQFLGRSPRTATAEDLRSFQLHMASHGVSSITINATISGLSFFFKITLGDHTVLQKMCAVHEPRKLPVVLSPEEVVRLLEASGIRRFLIHVLPHGFHRIRHYGFFANAERTKNLEKAQMLLTGSLESTQNDDVNASQETPASTFICPLCSAPMMVIETFVRGQQPRAPPGRRNAA